MGSSSARVVMFLSPMVLGTSARPAGVLPPTTTAGGAFTRSKMVPRLTANDSWRWPTNTRPWPSQPGTLTL